MKKTLSVVLTFIILATLSLSVFAANFVPSIEAKTAPEIIVFKDGSRIYGALIISEKTGETQVGVVLYDKATGKQSLEFFVVSAAEKEDAVLPAITEKLLNAQNQIAGVTNLGELTPGLDKEIEKAIEEFYGVNGAQVDLSDLVVTDLFDASVVRNRSYIEPIGDGQQIRFTINPSFTEDDFFVVLENTDGEHWEVVKDVEWTEDGNLIITADKSGVFAIAVEKSANISTDPNGPKSPKTDNQKAMKVLYAGTAVVCLGVAVFFFVKAKKRKTADY